MGSYPLGKIIALLKKKEAILQETEKDVVALRRAIAALSKKGGK